MEQLPHLETFATVAELNSFTAAAKVLRLSQAAVSQRIQSLEGTLNQSLFQRQGGRILLTEPGRKLYAYSQRILELHREARQEIAGFEPTVAGELSLAASSVPGEHLLPGLLSVFHTKYPQIRIRASISDSVSVMEQVQRGKVGLGLVGQGFDDPHLEFDYLAKDHMLLVVPPSHALAAKRKISLKELSRHPIILREVGSGLRYCFEKSLGLVGLSIRDLDVCLELGSNEAIKEAVMRGVGVAILSAYAVQKELNSAALKGLQVRDLPCDRDMFVIHDRRRVLSSASRQFLAFLRTHPIDEFVP